MSVIEPRGPQTKVKHWMLEEYLKAWGAIIVNGAKGAARRTIQRGQQFDLHLVYIDCFSYTGRYSGEKEDAIAGRPMKEVFGSPIIGIQALDGLKAWAIAQGVPVRTSAILIEIRRKFFKELLTSLNKAGLDTRVKQTSNFHSLGDGEISVLCADSTTLGADLINYSQKNYTFAFYFLDPYGPTGIPLKFIAPIISQKRTDSIIYMPYQDLYKKAAGTLQKPDKSNDEIAVISNYDQMYGNKIWQNVASQWADLIGSDSVSIEQRQDLEIKLIELYRDSLLSVDSELVVKALPLKFPDQDRTMHYIYLATHDSDGAMKMNNIIWKAGYQEHELRWQFRESKRQKGGQMPLFDFSAPPKVDDDRVSIDDIVDFVSSNLSGRKLTKKQLFKEMADELFLPGDIGKALTQMKKQGLVSYNESFGKLKKNDLITVK